jgi:hypothetical protein
MTLACGLSHDGGHLLWKTSGLGGFRMIDIPQITSRCAANLSCWTRPNNKSGVSGAVIPGVRLGLRGLPTQKSACSSESSPVEVDEAQDCSLDCCWVLASQPPCVRSKECAPSEELLNLGRVRILASLKYGILGSHA